MPSVVQPHDAVQRRTVGRAYSGPSCPMLHGHRSGVGPVELKESVVAGI